MIEIVFISQAIVRSPPNISFHITWNGDALPTSDLFYSSINLTAPSSSATVATRMRTSPFLKLYSTPLRCEPLMVPTPEMASARTRPLSR